LLIIILALFDQTQRFLDGQYGAGEKYEHGCRVVSNALI